MVSALTRRPGGLTEAGGVGTWLRTSAEDWVNPVFSGDGTSQLTVGLIRFTPGARTER